jgi:hypothetical protein
MVLVCALALACVAAAAEPARGDNGYESGRRLWWTSVAALGAATALDIQSSWGRREINPLLRSSDGRFGGRGVAIKIGVAGIASGLQWLVVRKHPRLETPLAGTNAGLAAMFAAAAVHNHRR